MMYINDLDLSSKVSKFADDTKLGINAANPESVRALQRDLAAIGEWFTVWQMPFNCVKPRKVPCPAQGHRQSRGKLFFAWFSNIQCGPRN